MRTFKKLSDIQLAKIQIEVVRMLHASRDCLRNQNVDTKHARFDVRDGYYGEAFGMMRTLEVLGYGEFGSDNIPNSIYRYWNLKWWFAQLCERTLLEENFGGTHECDHCFEAYGQDEVRLRRGNIVIPRIVINPDTV